MQCTIVHEIQGSVGRLRARSLCPLSKRTAQQWQTALEGIEGIQEISINPRSGSVLFWYSSAKSRAKALEFLQVEDTTPPVCTRSSTLALVSHAVALPEKMGKFPLLWPIVRYILLRPLMPPWLRIICSLRSAIPHLLQGLKSLCKGHINVELLDATAIGISLWRRDYPTVSMLTFLLGLGEALESWTRHHSREGLAQSLALDVDNVWVRDGDTEVRIPFSQLTLEHEVIVRTGAVIMVDGLVVGGEAVVNQSSMTGEPQGVVRNAGCSVYAGTVVEEGAILVRPTSLASETRLQKIIDFIEDSQSLKADIESRALRMADGAVPFTFLLAGLVYLVTRDPIRASSVLLVDYSCALRLATPLAILATMREAASRGVLIKGGVFLEALAEADTIVFDKTGTLTQAKPEVAEVLACEGSTPQEILRLAACMEEHFPHPVARAIVREAELQNLMHEEEHGEVEYVVAHGIASKLHGERVLLGSRHYVRDDENIDISPLEEQVERLVAQGYSMLYLAKGGAIAGIIAIRDTVRPEAADVIEQLKESGIKRVVMLTGDDRRAAKNMADHLGITEFHAGILPVDKAQIVQALQAQGCKVIMVGDGVNDAPGLSMADVGVSLRDGTDLAKEVADVVLLESNLQSLVVARQLGQKVVQRIKGNFVANMGLNSAFLAASLFGIITPTLSAVLHNVTTVGVTINATRPHLPVVHDQDLVENTCSEV